MFQPRIPVTSTFGAATEALAEAPAEGSFEVGTHDKARNLPAIRLDRFYIKKEVVIDVAHAEMDIAVEPTAAKPCPFQRVQRRAEVERND